MKKILILALLTLAVTTYSRDYEYNERRDIKMEVNQYDADRSGRINHELVNSVDELFHIELENQSRGHEDR